MEESLPNKFPHSMYNKKIILISGIIIVVVVLVIIMTYFFLRREDNSNIKNSNLNGVNNSNESSNNTSGSSSVDAGMNLSAGHCTGTGAQTLTYAPMNTKDISIIEPMGLMTGAHVTPIDHEYYYGINQQTSYDVFSPGSGTIVDIQNRKINIGNKDIAVPVNQYRIVITYSCTFFSYYDLLTSLSNDVQSKLPSSWDGQNSTGVNIPVTAGEVLGGVKGESLDFAVWDTTKPTKDLINATAYSNSEPWKIYTVAPLNYFNSTVVASIKPLYVRTTDPIDGKFGYDQEGKLVGTWFKVGSNGYAGTTDQSSHVNYWRGHASFVYNSLVPGTIEISLGNFKGDEQGQQFGVIGNSPDPANVTTTTGLVKYELADMSYIDSKGSLWNAQTFPNLPLKISLGKVEGTLLVQMEESHKLKFEIFVGKLPDQVSGFDSNALEYNRGDDAVMPQSNATGR